MIAMTAYLLRTPDVMHTAEMEREMVVTASRCGMLDMYGWLVPAIIPYSNRSVYFCVLGSVAPHGAP